MLRIVILEPDRYPPAAEALLRKTGSVIKFDPATGSLSDVLKDADVAVLRLKYLFDRELLEQAPSLKVIATATTGLDHIDMTAAAERGITVLSLRGETQFLETVTATAEHTWGLLLALLRHIPSAHQSVVAGSWDRTPFFGRELQGRTLGIIGLGRIGKMAARYGLAFRMQVAAYDPFQTNWLDGVAPAESLHSLISTADVISIHVPLSVETRGLIGGRELGWAKPGAILLNTSRGAVIDQRALLNALTEQRLGGAALDVIEDEYAGRRAEEDPLIRYAAAHSNLLLTPHLGGATHDSLEKTELFMAGKLSRHLAAASL